MRFFNLGNRLIAEILYAFNREIKHPVYGYDLVKKVYYNEW